MLPSIQKVVVKKKTIGDVVDTDILVETLRKIETRNFNRIEKTRVAILKKLYEELAYPPADIVGTVEWFEEKVNICLKLTEVQNMFRYVKLYMPSKHVHPKLAIDQLVEYCSLVTPTSFELPIWTERITKLQRGQCPLESLPSVRESRRPSVDNQLSKLFSYIGTKWNYNGTKQITQKESFEEVESPSIRAISIIHKPRTQRQADNDARRKTIDAPSFTVSNVRPFLAMTSSSQFSDIGSVDALDEESGINGTKNGSLEHTRLNPQRVDSRKNRRRST